jgi:MoxR-like ATPase
MYRLIASDLDETLIKADRTVCDENIEAIKKFMEMGGYFVCATGRPFFTAFGTLKELGQYEKEGQYVISFNGGAINENKGNRLLHYEGITFEQIVGEWNYQKQLLHLEAFKGSQKGEESIFEDDFFIRRPLLTSFMNDKPSLLLIDEIDKADEEVESFLLQALGEKQITVNDLGTFDLQNDLMVMLTSNAQRNLLEETKDRCLFLYISYPSVEREMAIVKARVPNADNGLVKKVVNMVHRIRTFNLNKKPSVRASIDWVSSVMHLDKDFKNVDAALEDSVGVAIKTEPDKAKVIKEIFRNEYMND